jgi:hypothetical protein
MKRIFAFLMICLISNAHSAFEISQNTVVVTPPQDEYESYFLNNDEIRIDKYRTKDIDEYTTNLQIEALDEYEQNIPDNVQPPALSPTQEKLAQILGTLLVYYFNAQQTAHAYFQEIKEAINNWYATLAKAIK